MQEVLLNAAKVLKWMDLALKCTQSLPKHSNHLRLTKRHLGCSTGHLEVLESGLNQQQPSGGVGVLLKESEKLDVGAVSEHRSDRCGTPV